MAVASQSNPAPKRYHPRIEPGIIHPSRAESASPPMTGFQIFVSLIALAALGYWAWLDPFGALFWLNASMMVAYLALSLYKFWIIQQSIRHQDAMTVHGDLAALDDSTLPRYTILIPLHKEREQVEGLVGAMHAMDYPKDKLEVFLLLEESDTETVAYCEAYDFPDFMRVLVVPRSQPQTKPKACNYGLTEATGEFLVIYDAEDRPESDQLKKSIAAFHELDDDVVCLQARLNFFNSRDNLLARWFTTEYSTWFDLYLPGLNATDAPIPLGGTSNHFKMSALRQLAGWDAFNVAEDCDLGMRLYRQGMRTRMLDSTTWEEACSRTWSWVKQRSRWIKGYLQTFLVHNRSPLTTMWEMGPARYTHFFFLAGLSSFVYLINPLYWLMALWWFVFRPDISGLFPPSVFIMGFICLFVGNFVFVFVTALGCVRRERYDLVRWAMLIPPYWILMSVAAWRALIQLIVRPYYWDKTQHGLTHTQHTVAAQPASPSSES